MIVILFSLTYTEYIAVPGVISMKNLCSLLQELGAGDVSAKERDMKIKSIELKNFKCFKDKILDLSIPETNDVQSTCILVGTNGSGKSSILKAIVAVMTGIDQRYAGDMLKDTDIYFDAPGLEIKLTVMLNENEKNVLQQDNNVMEAIYIYERGAEQAILQCPQGVNQDNYKKMLQTIEKDMRLGIVMYYDPFRFISGRKPVGPKLQLEKDAKSNALQSNILSEGNNAFRDMELKQWIINMDYQRLKKTSSKNEIIFEQMIKAFDILMHPLKFQCIDEEGAIIFRDEKESKDIALDMLSDGFKSVFFIVIDIIRRLSLAEAFEDEAFYMKEAVILIDEIDCHIHPKWQKKLLPSLRKLFPNCQFIVTTHSPYILDGIPDYSIKKIGEKQII